MNSQELIYDMVDRERGYFEKMMLGRLLLEREFFSRMRNVMTNDSANVESSNFTIPRHVGIWKAICLYHDTGGPATPIAPTHFHKCLHMIAQQGILPLSELQDVWQFVEAIVRSSIEAWGMVEQNTKSAATYWLKQVRKDSIMQQAEADNWNSEKITDTLRKENVHIDTVSRTERVSFGVWDSIDNIQPDIVRFKSSLTGLNVAIGGGFGVGEASIIIAASGGGKTVAGLQLATDFSLQGKRGVYLTTERSQGNERLTRRIISSHCNIPYGQIVNGVNMTLLQPSQQEAVAMLRERINDTNMKMVEWFRVGSTKSIGAGMREEVDAAAQSMGGLDYIVFDWIGGTLNVTDPAMLRHYYLEAAAIMAGDWNCVGIATTQADAAKGKNNMRVDNTACAECKTLDRSMTNVLGLTCFYLPDNKDGGQELYDRRQFFFVSKCRNGVGGHVPVYRDFGFQRFKNLELWHAF
jgi:KaiC/GvpD/RAD55 family RecA-like ATPase